MMNTMKTSCVIDACNSHRHDGVYIIAPAFNEVESIITFIESVTEVCLTLSQKAILVIVNDGSSDGTSDLIKRYIDNQSESKIDTIVLDLSKNFGHQSAIHAGLVYAYSIAGKNSKFIVMDSDLQHPPRLIPAIIEQLSSGFDHVQMVRDDNGQKNFKSVSSHWFYLLFKWLSKIDLIPGSSDFRGFDHQFLTAYLDLPESDRFLRGIFHWLGYNKCIIKYIPEPRYAGNTKYSLLKMIRFAFLGITSFSDRPLLLLSSSSVLFAIVCCISYIAIELYRLIFLKTVFVLGWMSLFFVVSFFGAIILCNQMLLSLYVSRLFSEQKRRPIFLIKSIHGEISANANKTTVC